MLEYLHTQSLIERKENRHLHSIRILSHSYHISIE